MSVITTRDPAPDPIDVNVDADIRVLYNEISNIKKCIAKMKNKQEKQSFEINAKLDKLLWPSTINTVNEELAITPIIAKDPTVNLSSFEFPLTTINDTNKLEIALSDAYQRQILVDIVLRKVGTNAGLVNGHYIIKIGNEIFSNTLLTQYTFRSNRRHGRAGKARFCDLKNILRFFQTVLHTVHPVFDETRTHLFIQNKLLKHSCIRVKRVELRQQNLSFAEDASNTTYSDEVGSLGNSRHCSDAEVTFDDAVDERDTLH